MDKIKVTAVSYLNTKPFLYGIEHSDLINELELSLDIPSRCSERLLNQEVDIGLVPITTIPFIDDAVIISEYCIGSTGAVKTVCLFSQCPLDDIETVLLDYHSNTSVELLKILLRDHWKLSPNLLPGEAGFEEKIGGTTAGLIIGDRVIPWRKRFTYEYDLGQAWQEHTGLPFVFAAWVSISHLESPFIDRFNEAIEFGVNHIQRTVDEFSERYEEHGFDVSKYFEENISYAFDDGKKKGMDHFLKLISNVSKEYIR